jgi:hypothetical protein
LAFAVINISRSLIFLEYKNEKQKDREIILIMKTKRVILDNKNRQPRLHDGWQDAPDKDGE